MNRLAPLFCICYDLSDDRERNRLARLLQNYGMRVQYSVFECHLTAASLRRLKQRLLALALVSGHVRIYRSNQMLAHCIGCSAVAVTPHAYVV